MSDLHCKVHKGAANAVNMRAFREAGFMPYAVAIGLKEAPETFYLSTEVRVGVSALSTFSSLQNLQKRMVVLYKKLADHR